MKKTYLGIVIFFVLVVAIASWFSLEKEKIENFGCDTIEPVSEHLVGLSPTTDISKCIFRNETRDEKAGIVSKGCKAPFYTRYLIGQEDSTSIIKNKEEFIEYFSPVTTKEEALAFATALTDAYPMEYIAVPQHWRMFTSYVEPTIIKITDDGFVVSLFRYDRCGCGPHTYHQVKFLVTTSGEVTEISSKALYENPDEDDLCVD